MKDGEYIELYWEDDPQFDIVRGWVGEAATRKAVETFAHNDWSREWTFRECYAANLQTRECRCSDVAYEVRLFDKPGRGRYKVSVLEPPKKEEAKP